MTLKILNLVNALARLLIRSNHEAGKEALANPISSIEDYNTRYRIWTTHSNYILMLRWKTRSMDGEG